MVLGSEQYNKNSILSLERCLLTKKEQLLAESKGVKDCVKWLEKRIKEKQKELEKVERYYGEICELDVAIKTLIEVKISLEKYSRKLKHEANEV